MNDTVSYLLQTHSHALVLLAMFVAAVGSVLSVLVIRRAFKAPMARKRIQIAMAALFLGATIWSAHFIAMLAYEPDQVHAYEPILTAMSFFMAVLGSYVAIFLLTRTKHVVPILTAGAVFGGTIVATHYIGMSAYLTGGKLVWDMTMVKASGAAAISLGMLAFHRIGFPITRFCWLAGASLLAVVICAAHFIGMAAFEIVMVSGTMVPEQGLPDTVLAVLIIAVMGLILIVGFMNNGIESNFETETRSQVRYVALHDQLTGLANRIGFTQEVDLLQDQLIKGFIERVAILTIDLDLFKQVNDLYGHSAGDTVLRTVSARLATVLPQDTFLSRSGGDEFIAIICNSESEEQIVVLGEKLIEAINEPVPFGQIYVTVGATIGIAISDQGNENLAELLHHSEVGMSFAKRRSGRYVCVYDPEMEEQSRVKLQLVNDLRTALAGGQFELAYQVQNDIVTLEPTGFEALLRWNHPEFGRVPPDRFIPIAEESGLIREIGLWVLRTACKEASQWPIPYGVAVNVAPPQLVHPSFVDEVARTLSETGLMASRLELEITEASIIDDHANTLRTMHALKKMGIRIAMDDFGTGYSSLSTLQTFPFDKIKVDRSFIENVHRDTQRAAIVRSTLLLGAALNIPVLAEGVEAVEELCFLQAERCSEVQGYYFGKPMNLNALREMVNKIAIGKAS